MVRRPEVYAVVIVDVVIGRQPLWWRQVKFVVALHLLRLVHSRTVGGGGVA